MIAGKCVVFRADASVQIGTGHVMRCLTLAEGLRSQGYECHFISREHPGHLNETIIQRGFVVHRLPPPGDAGDEKFTSTPLHAAWLGVSWRTDAEETQEVLRRLELGWLIVDHYAIDERWENIVREKVRRLLVIDDLADRPHNADILLDQNLGREAKDYERLVSNSCRLLIGPSYALLRPEFAKAREESLRRRARPVLRRLLVTMGGVDKDNITGTVLDALRDSHLPPATEIDVILGRNAPHLAGLRLQASSMPWCTRVHVDIPNMAHYMADADLAIGAAGSTSWERCCLGVPTLIWVLAENQRQIAMTLHAAEGAVQVSTPEELTWTVNRLVGHEGREILQRISAAASNIVTGEGISSVLNSMEKAGV